MSPKRNKKVVVVLPAYNAEKKLEPTLDDIPSRYLVFRRNFIHARRYAS